MDAPFVELTGEFLDHVKALRSEGTYDVRKYGERNALVVRLPYGLAICHVSAGNFGNRIVNRLGGHTIRPEGCAIPGIEIRYGK